MPNIPLLWTCPFCNRPTTVNDHHRSWICGSHDSGSKLGPLWLSARFITCPNPECKQVELVAELSHARSSLASHTLQGSTPIKKWQLVPSSSAIPLPDYIPTAIKEDYEEACAIRDLSPKASATLSRRCLQGMVRDFWKVKPGTLFEEINAIEQMVDPLIWEAIHAVRKLGNIGAHMEKDVNLVIEIETEEAQQLIGLIEMLITDWYVGRYERQQKLEAIKATAATKPSAVKALPPAKEKP